MHVYNASARNEFERDIDRVLAASFPASDPPPWTLGADHLNADARPHFPAAVAPAAVDVVIGTSRSRRRAASGIEALALAALLPAGVLIAAAPVLLVISAVAWLLGSR